MVFQEGKLIEQQRMVEERDTVVERETSGGFLKSFGIKSLCVSGW